MGCFPPSPILGWARSPRLQTGLVVWRARYHWMSEGAGLGAFALARAGFIAYATLKTALIGVRVRNHALWKHGISIFLLQL